MQTIKHPLYLAIATLVMFACGNKQEVAEQESDLIEITNQQFETDSMQFGEIKTKLFENIVKCNGTIVPLPNGIAKLNAPLNGIIKSISCFNGESVDKNQTLIEITGNEIIEIQKEFAEASANHRRLKSEYERIKSLYNEKVTAEKDFIVAETEFKTSMAKYSGLKLRIESIGLTTSKIENGEFYSSYHIKSPIKGYISTFNASIGSFIDSQVELMEIINPDMFQVKLSVFSNEIANLKKGQTVRFKSTNTENYQLAIISSIGVAIDNETKSIECFATMADKKLKNPIAYEFVECEIVTRIDSVKALPSDAIIKTENGYAILALEKQHDNGYSLEKIDISIGKHHNGYTQIITDIDNYKVLTKGLYNIVIE
jgi:cobalt-zinc-cadmium efflux system membrane fusion protein